MLTGGLVGGIIGPELSKHTRDLFAVPFLGAYASLIVFCLITLVLLAYLRIPPPSVAERHEPVRPLARDHGASPPSSSPCWLGAWATA